MTSVIIYQLGTEDDFLDNLIEIILEELSQNLALLATNLHIGHYFTWCTI